MTGYAEALHALEALQVFGIRLGLDNVRAYCAAAGHPERRYASFHVAGTNGKGTTAACLAAIGTRHGFRTGLYTSPHVVDLRERIVVDGRPIEGGDLVAAWDRIAPFVTAREMTFFEAVTLIAFEHFAAEQVELAVLEVGMGGRLDATNVVTPRAAIVTNVARDHERHLGVDRPAIAREKGGIFKPGVPALVGEPGPPEVRAVLSAAASAGGARARFLPDEVAWSVRRLERAETVFDYDSRASSPLGGQRVAGALRAEAIGLPLMGAHFAGDAALALWAWEVAGPAPPDPHRLRAALSGVAPAGRTEWRHVDGVQYLFDVAHNPAAAGRLSAALGATGCGRSAIVAGILADKEWPAMLDRLEPAAARVWLCGVETASADRRLGSREAAPLLAARPWVVWADSVAEGLAAARAAVAVGEAEQVVVTGSFHTVGEALLALGLATPGEPYMRGSRHPAVAAR
ncbi:MAG TPA: Mur ligase family protein [Gemmatimonadota bacterium]|nr:Mur ligase family protein [Gemmatimonadota bacterium]